MKGNHFNFNHITQCRTTNAAEGFHSALKKDPRHLKHPTVLNVLNFLQSITSEQDERILKLVNGQIIPKKRKQKTS